MKALKVLGKRLAFGAVAAWGVLTIVFAMFTLTRDWIAAQIEGNIIFGATGPGQDVDWDSIEQQVEYAIGQYLSERGLDRPWYELYYDFMTSMILLDWDQSFETGEDVFPMVMEATLRTAMYVVPAIILAVIIGILLGLYVAINPESRLANSGRLAAYTMFALPGFWIGGVFIGAVEGDVIAYNQLLFDHVLPIALVTMTLLGGYVSYSRAYAAEHVSADFVKLVRAKGASPLLITKHVVRNAAIPIFSMLFTEALGLLVLAIFVLEVVFGIDGFGLMFFFAIQARDIPVLMGATIVIVIFGIFGNIIQDLSYQYLDPRVEASG